MNGGLLYTAEDGTEWQVTLESPGKILSVPPSLEKSGAMLPEHEVRIVFTSGETVYSEEYTAMTQLEDLSDNDLEEWFNAARKGEGL
ncbi:MAG TPA: hypothetical protein VMN39_06960 [Longimicrobiaceae bacterium]|nr:hypothetical protein [Longimicrobiaceae bacterium]